LSSCPNACERACYECLYTGRNVYWHRFLDRHAALVLLDRFDGDLTLEYELPAQIETASDGRASRGTNDAEDRLGRILERAGFDGFEAKRSIDIGPPYNRTLPDFVYDVDGKRVAIYLDGLSTGIHGSERARLQDAVIRDQLADLGWDVIAI